MKPYRYEGPDDGDSLRVAEARDGVFVTATEAGGMSEVFVPATELADLCVALFRQSGQPAPVITPRPDIDPRTGYDFGPLRFSVADRGGVKVEAGAVTEVWAPHRVRQMAGYMVAVADAAEAQPDPADVTRLEALVLEAEQMPKASARDIALRLLRSGLVILAAEDGGRG